jgi:tetratricopeptide (TPR) repeat protein
MSEKESAEEFKKGQKALLQQVPDLELAEVHLKKAIALNPDGDEARGWLAAAMAQAGRFPEALAEMKIVVELAPEDPRHRVALGSIYLHSGRWEEAVESLTKGIELRPEHGEAEARVYLAQALEHCGKIAPAIEQWKWIAAIDDGYPNSEQLKGAANHRIAKLE